MLFSSVQHRGTDGFCLAYAEVEMRDGTIYRCAPEAGLLDNDEYVVCSGFKAD